MSNGTKAKIVFKEELSYIKSTAIKSFTIKCFEKLTSNYFWDFTASSTQTHHPKVSNKKHGIILHTKLCVWWGRKLADSFDCKDLDIIISSLLLHDLQKFGKKLDEDNKPTLAEYCGTHGPMLAIQMESLFSNVNEEIENDINTIIGCVALHMGRFTNKTLRIPLEKYVPANSCIISEIVQLSDYCASRKVDTKLEELDNWEFPS